MNQRHREESMNSVFSIRVLGQCPLEDKNIDKRSMCSTGCKLFSLARHHSTSCKLKHYSLPFFKNALRLKSGKDRNEGSIQSKNHADFSNETPVLEVYDVPFEQQWEENPEFDYSGYQLVPVVYDFVSPNELFELDELRLVLKKENIRDLVFLRLPTSHIAEFMVIGSGTSAKHVRSTAELIYRILKYKRRTSAMGIPRVEGLEGSGDWIAINLGNVLLHLFLPSVRAYYNLESLWAAGARFDEVTHLKKSPHTGVRNQDVSWDELLREVQQQHMDTASKRKPTETTSTPSRQH